jgi:hypothetical protein
MARIVLIEAPDSGSTSLLNAIAKANSLGAGVVSMSFGGTESAGFTASADSYFAASNMTYVAASGDSGYGVQWPAVSTHVVAVGGTSLSYSGTGTRTETAWSGSGGGVSAYTATPGYQSGISVATHRSVADVSFNADPSTGQYLAVIKPGSTAAGWMSVGGTSLAAPQWAGILAISNAQRVLAAKPVLGDPHGVIYNQIAAAAGNYASAFDDVTTGADGSCSLCGAHAGYDTPTGLGTPNTGNILSLMLSNTVPPAPPVVTAATINGNTGTALSFTISATGQNSLVYAISGQPSGMALNANTGAVTWASPVAGTYTVKATVTDSKNALTGTANYTVVITAPAPPAVTSATANGTVGTALSYTVVVTNSNSVTYSLSAAPTGMTISHSGVLSWATPVIGTYSVKVTVTDTVTHLTATATITVVISAAPVVTNGPVITTSTMTGVAGKSMSGTITFKDSGAQGISISLSGIPMGMALGSLNGTSLSAGISLSVNWVSPVTGNYTIKVTATDNLGRSAQISVPVTITAK